MIDVYVGLNPDILQLVLLASGTIRANGAIIYKKNLEVIKMDLVLNNTMFEELSLKEMYEIEGGDFWRHLGYAGATVCVVGACIATGPIVPIAAGAAGLWCWYDATR